MNTEFTKNALEKFCEEHGLPVAVSSIGWAAQECTYSLNDDDIGVSKQASKGWLYLKQIDDDATEDEDPVNFSKFDELWSVILAFIEGKTTETELYVTFGDTDFVIRLNEIQMEAKNQEFTPVENIKDIIVKYLNENDIEIESVLDDDGDLDIDEFIDEYADASWGDTEYDLFNEFAMLEFENGTLVEIVKNNDSNHILIARVNEKDVSPDAPFSD